jgi:hypothetical protein
VLRICCAIQRTARSTLLDYVTEWRMQKAVLLAKLEEMKLVEVAQSVGYESDAASATPASRSTELLISLFLSPSMYFTYPDHNRPFQSLGICVTGKANVTGLAKPGPAVWCDGARSDICQRCCSVVALRCEQFSSFDQCRLRFTTSDLLQTPSISFGGEIQLARPTCRSTEGK